ncbi:O-antigen ligase family protein [Phocaeicola barnesiae]|uniref:O-antigen ligase family protein n=2 Tax=Phocaeicola barnesiae TaxID=376804 RepID=UPI0025A489FA|nr:O-antigen ligase family protein [Phocaeicola barnesiae]MDM8258591.1 O-antigen ligase family protein [Phocaeicola barnesiae]
MEVIRYSGGKEICVALGVTILLALFLFRVEDSYRIGLLLVAGALLLLRPLPFRKWSRLDGCVAALALSDLFSCFYAACPIPALDAAFYSVYMLATYFVCRRLFAHGRALQVLRVGSLFPIGAALLLAVCSFFVFRSSVLEAGFENTYHFRFLFRPLGYITNIWAEVLLMVSGWICLMRRWSVPLQFLCLLAILLSFSRGAYVALGIYLLFALLFFPKAEKLRLWLPAVAAMLLVAVLLPKEMHTTLQMNRTASQQQSTESRISGTAAAWQAFTERPFMGYGNGNYTYAVDAITGQDSTKPFTSIAPSLPVQLLVEKGICGTLVYLFAGIMIVRTLWQHRKKPDSRIIAATLLAVLVKDFAQATWLGTPVLLLMSYILPAYLQRDETLSAETDRTAYMVPAFAVALWVSWNIPSFRFLTDSTLDYLQDRNYDAACACHPEDVQLQYLYALSVANEYPEKSDSILESLASRYPRNSLYLSAYARRCYQQGDSAAALQLMAQAVRYTPRMANGELMQAWKHQDSLFYNRVWEAAVSFRPAPGAAPADYARYGYLAYTAGDTLQAEKYLRQAVRALPNLTTPWLLLGDTMKYRLLIYGAFQRDLSHKKLPEQPVLTSDSLFYMNYDLKVQNWYGGSLNQ